MARRTHTRGKNISDLRLYSRNIAIMRHLSVSSVRTVLSTSNSFLAGFSWVMDSRRMYHVASVGDLVADASLVQFSNAPRPAFRLMISDIAVVTSIS